MTKTPQEEEDEMFEALLKAAGFHEIPQAMPPRCTRCVRAWEDDQGIVHCGANPDEEPKPRWAVIKYSIFNLFLTMADMPLANTDCENLDPVIAEHCKAFKDGKESRESSSTKDQEGPEA